MELSPTTPRMMKDGITYHIEFCANPMKPVLSQRSIKRGSGASSTRKEIHFQHVPIECGRSGAVSSLTDPSSHSVIPPDITTNRPSINPAPTQAPSKPGPKQKSTHNKHIEDVLNNNTFTWARPHTFDSSNIEIDNDEFDKYSTEFYQYIWVRFQAFRRFFVCLHHPRKYWQGRDIQKNTIKWQVLPVWAKCPYFVILAEEKKNLPFGACHLNRARRATMEERC